MTSKLFRHLQTTRARLRLQVQRLESGELRVQDMTKTPPEDVTALSIERVKELLADTDDLIRIYGAEGRW